MTSLTPDPHEERLPVWVRDELRRLRLAVRDAEAVAAAVRGEHEGSNVRLIEKHGNSKTFLPHGSHVAFASAWGEVQVGHDLSGRIRIQGDSTLLMRLNAGNALTVELEDH